MKFKLATAFLLCALTVGANAQENPAHNQLRALRDGMVAGMNSGDIEAQLTYLHPNVVVTWHNAEVSRGRVGVRNYLQKMLQGPNKVVEKFGVEVTVDELSILHGENAAIAFGSAKEHFTLVGNKQFDFTGRWTATMVKEDGKWLVASLHASDNIFDNPLLNMAKKAWWWVGGGALVIGALVGWMIGRRR